MTYLEIVNKVLIRLREDTVATVSESIYSTLIGEFVQQALSEVADAHEWNAMRSTVVVTTVAGDINYALTDSGTSFSIECVFNNTEDCEVAKAPSSAWMTHMLLSNDVTRNQPTHYAINGVSATGDAVIEFYPPPDAVYNVNVNLKMKTTLSADSDPVWIDTLPIILKALLLAVDERGDDSGMTVDTIQGQFNNALSNAVAFDRQLNEDEGIWEVE